MRQDERRFDANGAALGSQFQVNTFTTGYQLTPAVAADGAGNFAVVWSSYGSSGSDSSAWSVQGRRYETEASPTACVEDVDTICLLGGRFRVEMDWQTTAGGSGTGQVVRVTDTTTLFWFFSSANIEFLVKVLDGCPVNGRYWVFGAGATDVAYTLRVTDTATAATSTYEKAAGSTAPAITDTSACATCSRGSWLRT